MIRVMMTLLLITGRLMAQQADPDPRLLGLALMRARGELELADSTYARTRHLFERRMVSASELEERSAERERAAIEVLERWSALTAAMPRLRVVRAIKARAADGALVARLQIAALGEEALGVHLPEPLPHDLLARLRTMTPVDAFVSVKDEPGLGGTSIGVPYEQRVAAGVATVVRQFEFRLLRDVDAVVVSLASGGRVDERKVWLEADVTGVVAVQPVPFSQEADLGAEAVYDLTIERTGGDDAPLRLLVSNLPPAVAYGFTDAESGARIGQLRFGAGEHARRVRLTVSLPPGDGGALAVDSAYRFLMIAAPRRDGGRGAEAHRSATEWREDGAGVAELEVVPRGVGRAELRVFNLFHEATAEEGVELEAIVRNAGSRVLDRVRVLSELPPGWSASSEPEEVRDLEPNGERAVRVALTPVPGAELGDYEARLQIDGTSGRTRLTGDPTVIRVRLRARSGAVATVLLLGAVLAGAAGAVMLTRRLASR
jgi:hypothetical protein